MFRARVHGLLFLACLALATAVPTAKSAALAAEDDAWSALRADTRQLLKLALLAASGQDAGKGARSL